MNTSVRHCVEFAPGKRPMMGMITVDPLTRRALAGTGNIRAMAARRERSTAVRRIYRSSMFARTNVALRHAIVRDAAHQGSEIEVDAERGSEGIDRRRMQP